MRPSSAAVLSRQATHAVAFVGTLCRHRGDQDGSARSTHEDVAADDRIVDGDGSMSPMTYRIRKLLSEGYDRDLPSFFVIDEINAMLTRYRATHMLDPDDQNV